MTGRVGDFADSVPLTGRNSVKCVALATSKKQSYRLEHALFDAVSL